MKTTLIVEDMSTDGRQEGMLLFNFPGLDALVNVGSGQERVMLPAMERVIGADDLSPTLQSALQTSYGSICGAIEQIGASRLMALQALQTEVVQPTVFGSDEGTTTKPGGEQAGIGHQ